MGRRVLTKRDKIAEELAGLIRNKKLKPGDRLPSPQQLANEYGVAPGTARNALLSMQQQRLAVPIHGKGWFVTDSSTSSLEERVAALEEAVKRIEALLTEDTAPR